MSKKNILSPAMMRSSEQAASYQYDTSKFVISTSNVKRDINTGRLTQISPAKNK